MRNVFNKVLLKKAKKNKNIFLLTADLGYNSFEIFQSQISDRFVNCGVSENNMIGIATGLALRGKKVFVYSIIPFLIHRSFEQIKNNIAVSNLDIKLVGAGGGFSYAEQGVSHNPTEDIAIMNTLPNFKIFSPGTRSESLSMINYMISSKGPSYIRLTKAPEFDYINKKNISKLNPSIVQKGKKVLILVTGNIIENVINALPILEKKGIKPTIVSFPCIKPFQESYFLSLLKDHSLIYTVEEHSIIGGLSSIINNILFLNSKNLKIHNFALEDKAHIDIGTHEYLRKINKLDAASIANKIIRDNEK